MIKTILNSINTKWLCHLMFVLFYSFSFGQGYNHNFLMGYTTNPTLNKARINFTANTYTINPELRKIPFWDTQGNISDINGNLLMSSNGYYIANSTGDTMLNGSGINPAQFTEDYKTFGLPLAYANLFIPMPADSQKFVLFHLTLDYNSPTLAAPNIFYSIVDPSQDSVVSKNIVAATGSFGWSLSTCKHGNGRDWWIVAMSDSGSVAHKMLLTPNALQYLSSQSLQVPSYPIWAGQPTFSPDGSMFAYSHTQSLSNGKYPQDIRLFDFDRCSGQFNLKMYAPLADSSGGMGIAFSPDSKNLYVSSYQKIYQFKTDSVNISATKTVVAINDTFLSAPPNLYTNFHMMYLAANGKIYISSGSSVQHLHEINYPDSSGLSCDVQLHNVFTNCFFIGVPNHPNYYLGRKIGSLCDTLTSINDLSEHDFRFSIYPNPSNGNFKIIYLLPQNKSGTLQIFDITGKQVYKQNLPQWSTLQNISLPKLSSGVYNCAITSGTDRVNKKLIVLNE